VVKAVFEAIAEYTIFGPYRMLGLASRSHDLRLINQPWNYFWSIPKRTLQG